MGQKRKILVVDDDWRMARSLVDILNSEGYKAEEVHSVEDAERRMQGIAFDCVLSDIRMPDRSGVDLVRTISDEQPGTPVILMTAYASDDLVQDGFTEGVAAVLTKPVNIRRLLNRLSRLCQDIFIVVIDDDAQFRRSIQDVLQYHNYNVQTYKAFADIDITILNNRGVILLVGMKLEGKSGIDIIFQVRSEHPDLPVILITGPAEEMAGEVARSLGKNAHPCLKKPVDIPELLGVIKDVRIKDSMRIQQDVLY